MLGDFQTDLFLWQFEWKAHMKIQHCWHCLAYMEINFRCALTDSILDINVDKKVMIFTILKI